MRVFSKPENSLTSLQLVLVGCSTVKLGNIMYYNAPSYVWVYTAVLLGPLYGFPRFPLVNITK